VGFLLGFAHYLFFDLAAVHFLFALAHRSFCLQSLEILSAAAVIF
jgi:hypothetical protein